MKLRGDAFLVQKTLELGAVRPLYAVRKCGPVRENEIGHQNLTVILVTACIGSMMKQSSGKVRKVLDLWWS